MSESPVPERSNVERWTLWLVGALAIILGAVLWWATGGFGDSEQPNQFPGSATGCVTYEGSPYISDPLVWVGAFLLAGVAFVWLVAALMVYRGKTRVLTLAVWLVLAFDAWLVFVYAQQLYNSEACAADSP